MNYVNPTANSQRLEDEVAALTGENNRGRYAHDFDEATPVSYRRQKGRPLQQLQYTASEINGRTGMSHSFNYNAQLGNQQQRQQQQQQQQLLMQQQQQQQCSNSNNNKKCNVA
jgi:hypothetical protein